MGSERVDRWSDQEGQAVVLVLDAVQSRQLVRRHLRGQERVQPERVDVHPGHQQPRGKPGEGPAEQPAAHLAGDTQGQGRPRAESGCVLQLPVCDHGDARGRGGRRSALPAAPPDARGTDVAGHRPAAVRIRRHVPVRTLGQHGPAVDVERRLAHRRTGRGDPEDDPGDRTVLGPDLPQLRRRSVRRAQQHEGAELHVPRRDLIRHRRAHLQNGMERHVRLSGGLQLRVPTDHVYVPQRHADQPDPVGGPVHGAQRGEPRLRRLRPGQLADGEDDRHRRHPVRLVQDRIPRADHRSRPRAGRTPESQHQLSGERQPQLERPHVPIGHGVRPARRRQDGDQGGGEQVSARADAQRLRSGAQPRQRAANEHDPPLGGLEP